MISCPTRTTNVQIVDSNCHSKHAVITKMLAWKRVQIFTALINHRRRLHNSVFWCACLFARTYHMSLLQELAPFYRQIYTGSYILIYNLFAQFTPAYRLTVPRVIQDCIVSFLLRLTVSMDGRCTVKDYCQLVFLPYMSYEHYTWRPISIYFLITRLKSYTDPDVCFCRDQVHCVIDLRPDKPHVFKYRIWCVATNDH